MTEARGKILVLGTADWNQAIATNQHYIVRELAREFPIIYTESMGLRTPELKMRDIKRMARRIGIGSHPDAVAPRRVPAGVEIRSPKVLPKHTGVAHRFNQPRVHDLVADWIAQPGPRLLWAYTPVTYGLEEFATAVVYHCVDLLREGPGIDADLIDRNESHLAEIGAHAIGTSPAVVENLKVRGFTEVEYWPNVADTAVIEAARPATIQRVPGRVVFAGNLIPAKVDFDLLRTVIEAGYDLHLAGPVADGAGNARELVNDLVNAGATHHGTLALPDLAALYWTAEVGLIPYVLNDLTRGISPLKTYEYLAAGLSVVSSALPSMSPIEDHVAVTTREEFVAAVKPIATNDAVEERRRIAAEHSWNHRGERARRTARTLVAPRDAAPTRSEEGAK